MAPRRTDVAAQGEAAERRAEGLLGLTRRASQEEMRAAGLGQIKTHRYFSTSSDEDGATTCTTAEAYRRQDRHLRRWEGTGV